MLTSYALLHTPPRPNRSTCTLAGGGRPGRLTRGATTTPPLQSQTMEMDDLASSTSEQWRLRVGRLWGIPYEEHPPEVLQTADARLVSRSGWPGWASSRELDAALFAPAERAAAAAWVGKVVTPLRTRALCVEPLRARRACAGGRLQPSSAAARCWWRVGCGMHGVLVMREPCGHFSRAGRRGRGRRHVLPLPVRAATLPYQYALTRGQPLRAPPRRGHRGAPHVPRRVRAGWRPRPRVAGLVERAEGQALWRRALRLCFRRETSR